MNINQNSNIYDPEQIAVMNIKTHQKQNYTSEFTDDSHLNYKTTIEDNNTHQNKHSLNNACYTTLLDENALILRNKLFKGTITDRSRHFQIHPVLPKTSNKISVMTPTFNMKQSSKTIDVSENRFQHPPNTNSFNYSLSSVEHIQSNSQSGFSSNIINSQIITDEINDKYPDLLIVETHGSSLNGNKLIISPAGLKNSPRYYGDGFVFFGDNYYDSTNNNIVNDVILQNSPSFHELFKIQRHFFVIFFNSQKHSYFIRSYFNHLEIKSTTEDDTNNPLLCEKASHNFTLNYFMVKITTSCILNSKEFVVINDKVFFIEINKTNFTDKETYVNNEDNLILKITLLPNTKKHVKMKTYTFNSKNKKKVILGRDKNCDIVFINDKNMSKIHCTFYYNSHNKKWFLRDGGNKDSLNGTYIMPRHSYELTDGCEIRTITNSKFKVKLIFKKQNLENENLEHLVMYNSDCSLSEIF